MKKYRYNVKCNGATFSSDRMIGIAVLIARNKGLAVNSVYKTLVGRYPTVKQQIWAAENI